ncbi:MAG TPA: tetratricopeptide repeat protein [Vicinamibacterales bacterium]|nr:tetratricopeptide repeat protein [Vicinamibacterales bacterium]
MNTTDRIVICGVLALSAGVVYVNALHNPFVYDDYHTVVVNTSLARIADVRAIVLHDVTRPIVNFSYALDQRIWGPQPFGFHVTSVLLHMLNVVLFWRLASTLTGAPRAATAGAALFAVHPMMTEAVGYISGRSEVLCATFFLSAFLAGVAWLRSGRRSALAAMLVFWVAALASKETAAMFPFVFGAWAYGARGFQPGARSTKGVALLGGGMAAFTVLAGVARLYVLARIEYPGRVAIHWPFLLLDVNVVARYLLLLVRPAGQTIFHSVPLPRLLDWRAIGSVALVGGIGVAAWRLRRTEPAAAAGIAWFLLLLAPSAVLTLVDQGEPMTEHRVYAAGIGFFLACGVGIDRVATRLQRQAGPFGPADKQYAFAALAFRLVLLSLAFLTVLRNEVWADPIALWQESVTLAPDHYRPRLLLGEALLEKNRTDDAIEQFNTAIRLRPDIAIGYLKLARCYADVGRFDEAKRLLVKAHDLDPSDPIAPKMLDAVTTIQARLKPGPK